VIVAHALSDVVVVEVDDVVEVEVDDVVEVDEEAAGCTAPPLSLGAGT
jgi:hypothetical protein